MHRTVCVVVETHAQADLGGIDIEFLLQGLLKHGRDHPDHELVEKEEGWHQPCQPGSTRTFRVVDFKAFGVVVRFSHVSGPVSVSGMDRQVHRRKPVIHGYSVSHGRRTEAISPGVLPHPQEPVPGTGSHGPRTLRQRFSTSCTQFTPAPAATARCCCRGPVSLCLYQVR